MDEGAAHRGRGVRRAHSAGHEPTYRAAVPHRRRGDRRGDRVQPCPPEREVPRLRRRGLPHAESPGARRPGGAGRRPGVRGDWWPPSTHRDPALRESGRGRGALPRDPGCAGGRPGARRDRGGLPRRRRARRRRHRCPAHARSRRCHPARRRRGGMAGRGPDTATARDVAETARTITDTDLSGRIPDAGESDELGDLVRTVNAMLDRVESGVAAQRRFVDDAGHELRTPITIVRGPPGGPRPDRSGGRAGHRRARRRRAGPDEPDGVGPAVARPFRAAVVPARRARSTSRR